MRLRDRITLPFVLLFVAAYVATAIVSISLVARAVERRLAIQTENLARLLAGAPGLQESPQTLQYIKRAYGAEILVYEGETPVASTAAPVPFRREPGRLQDNGALYEPLGGDRALVMIYSPAVVSQEKTEAVRPFIILAGIVVILAALIGYATAHTIAKPLERLAAAARRISSGEKDVVLPAAGGAEIRDLAVALNRMTEAIRASERLAVMGQMAAGVAHEIKNPLSAMKMTVQMLEERQPEPEREPYRLILREIERLELAASELSSTSARPLERRRARLDAVVSEVLELLRRQLDHLRISVERKLEPVPEAEVDIERFKRMAMNLILNGAQAMPQGGPLEVGLSARDGRVRLSVADRGPGVPPELRARIFEPFVTTKQDGVGLGLALTKRIVEDHGGTVGFDTSDRGSTFWVELPLSAGFHKFE